jgi:tetratricopeptide (TPR) repeat protein
MKKSITIILFIFISLCCFAQRELKYLDRSKSNAVFGGQPNEACVTISSHKNIHPIFLVSNTPKQAAKIDTLGSDINYHLVFDASPGREKREINIYVNGFSPLIMKWTLSPKQQLNYYIFDPDSTIVDCYSQLLREGLNLYKSGMYEDARKKYLASKDCSNVPSQNDIADRIALIDSIQVWKNLGDMFYTLPNYSKAIEEYQKIYTKNPEDKYIGNRLLEVMNRQREICTLTFMTAENYFNEKSLDKAKSEYEKVIKQSCYNSAESAQKIQMIEVLKQLPHVLTYESGVNTPIGISTGGYKDYNSSGYFTIRFNPILFKAIRSDFQEGDKPEFNISFGWTLKIVKPVWIFFGPGYTGVGECLKEISENNTSDTKVTMKIKSAVSPEVGLLGKVRINDRIGIALRYTYQYRYATEKDMVDYIGKSRHVLGIGFCF